MNKVISSELKKMISRPGVYVLAVLLAIILVVTAFVYKPKERGSSVKNFGTTIEAQYNNFYGGDTGYENSGTKSKGDANINEATTLVNTYFSEIDGKKVFTKDKVNTAVANLKASFAEFCESYVSTSYMQKCLNDVKNKFETLNNIITNSVNKSADGAYLILVVKSKYTKYQSTASSIANLLNVSEIDSVSFRSICSGFKELEDKFYGYIDGFIYPQLSKSIIANYSVSNANSTLNVVQKRLNGILSELQDIYTNSNLSEIEKVKQFNIQANAYLTTSETYLDLVKHELLVNAFEVTTSKQQMNLLYPKVKDESEYESKTQLIKLKYTFNHYATTDDYAKPLQIGISSNPNTNAYDYAYFVLKLFAFIIIIYSVLQACHTIAGEIKEGSMRYLAIRPVSRTKLLMGKFIAIMAMCSVLILFSGIISLIVGGFVHGFSTLNILTIFNGTTAILVHPIVMILICMFSLLIQAAIYTSIALMLSCLLKSDLIAVTLVLALYLINSLLPIFFSAATSWLAIYPFSHISINAIFTSAGGAGVWNSLLGEHIYVGTNLAVTVIIVLAILFITNIVSTIRFSTKEL